MGKLCLYFKKHEKTEIGNSLKVKIDDSIITEIASNNIYEVELSDGEHNIKAYTEGWNKDEMVGYIDQNIEINKDTYFTYKSPLIITGKGQLIKENFSSPEEFKKSINKSTKLYKIIMAILVIIAIILLLFS